MPDRDVVGNQNRQTADIPLPVDDDILGASATELAKRIRKREVSSFEVVQRFIERIQDVNPQINAVCCERFEQALQEARHADADHASEGTLRGVPITIKESFHVSGLPTTIGLTKLKNNVVKKDGVIARELRQAGAIILAKTNVSMLMFANETDNPVYGRTLNPWNHERTPGGSTGGEAALIAVGGSPLGIGGDLGGSIRVPCHFCGIQGLKPTNTRITRQGAMSNIGGLKALEYQPGPMSRHVEDLQTCLNILSRNVGATDAPASTVPDYRNVELSQLRIGIWSDYQPFPISSPIQRAIEQSASVLREAGAFVGPFHPPRFAEAIRLYFAIMGGDGGAGLRALSKGSKMNGEIRQLLLLGGIPRVLRPILAFALRQLGQIHAANLLAATGACSAAQFWELTRRRDAYEREFTQAMDEQCLDAILLPPYALPAIYHETATDLLAAGCYAYIVNLVGLPAGVVAVTRVGQDERIDRSHSRDRAVRLAAKCEVGSAGLPIGVQIAARHWREDIVMALMDRLEKEFRKRPDFPTWKSTGDERNSVPPDADQPHIRRGPGAAGSNGDR